MITCGVMRLQPRLGRSGAAEFVTGGRPAFVQVVGRSQAWGRHACNTRLPLLARAAADGPRAPTPLPAYGNSRTEAVAAALARLAKPLVCCLAVGLAACLLPAAAQAAAGAAAAGGPAAGGGAAGLLKSALSFVLHLDVHLGEIIARYGAATYAILFTIVFAETGFVLTPFLPGDSLLFATGAFAALGKLNILALVGIYITAATLGDAVNYAAGNFLGARAIQSGLVKKEYIDKTEQFYAKYGGKAVVLARFVPIVRTVAPFVAGVGSMNYAQFGLYNVAGAVLWTAVCTGAGYAFGNVPAVHDNFTVVVLGIVVVSVLPVAYELWAARREAQHKGGEGGGSSGGGSPKLA